MSRELLQIRVNDASKCSKMKIFDFQRVVCENCSKLETNSLNNLKASMKYYADDADDGTRTRNLSITMMKYYVLTQYAFE